MSQPSNKISQFWQELKRRNVVRVITVYAASAFVILELVDIITEPFGLPGWTLKLVVVLLAVGLLVAIILSWIYDIHPEGGVVKTEPVNKVKPEDVPRSSNSWKVASYISFVVIVVLIVLNIVPRAERADASEDLERSIAVLPFENMSDDASYSHIGGAFTDEIIMELQKIKAFDRVLSRTSTMQYEKNRPTAPEIAEKLNVNYIIEGSIQRMQGRVRVRVQVIRAKNEDHIWGETYDEVFMVPADLLDIQSKIAHAVADELKVVITPEEKELIEKVPTNSLTAYDLYQRGREKYVAYLMNISDQEAIRQAEILFRQALEFDSTFAKAYAGLAMTYFSNLISMGPDNYIVSQAYFDNAAFDPVLYWANKAMQYDDQLSEAYVVRGKYYLEMDQLEKAEADYNTALSLNSSSWEANFGLGELYFEINNIEALEYYRIAALLNPGNEAGLALFRIWLYVSLVNLADDINSQIIERIRSSLDSATYYSSLGRIEGNTEAQREYYLKAYAFDSTVPWVLDRMAVSNLELGNVNDGISFLKKLNGVFEDWGKLTIQDKHRFAYALFQAGLVEEAEKYFDWQEDLCKKAIELNRYYAQKCWAHYDLAGVYAFRGEKDQALELLSYINQKSSRPLVVGYYIEWDPLFDNLRDDEEFKRIEGELQVKFEQEKERISQWLEENGLL